MNIDLRKEFHELMEESGHYILLQRTSRKLRCMCWNEKYQEADGSCPRCLGEGWVSRIERHLLRKQSALRINYLTTNMKQTPMGEMNVGQMNFFMEHDAKPQKGDVIMEVGWNKQRPTHLIRTYDIADVQDYRLEKGRVEYYVASCVERSADVVIRGYAVRQLGPVKNYELLKQGAKK